MKLAMNMAGRRGAQAVELGGELVFTVIAIEGGAADVACELRNALVKIAAPAGPEPAHGPDPNLRRAEQEFAAELSRRFILTRSENGAIVGLRFPKDLNRAAANLLMVLATATQFVTGPKGEKAWIVSERDPNGQYSAAYRELVSGRFHKQKAQYFPNSTLVADFEGAGASTPPSMRIVRSEADFDVDASGRVYRLRSRETLALAVLRRAFEVTVEVELGPARRSSAGARIAAELLQARNEMEPRPLVQFALDPKNSLLELDRATLRGADFDDLTRKLAALPPAGEKATEAERTLKHELEALFRQNPAAAARAPALVRAEGPTQGKLVVDALTLAGGAPALEALANIATDSAAGSLVRGSAIRYLAHHAEPPPVVVDKVASLLDDSNAELRRMARFCYGALARRAPKQSQRITSELLSRLERSESAAERLELVTALGNSGANAALPALRPYLDAAQPFDLRLRAIESLRFMNDPAVDPLLESILRSKEPDALRVAAITAIRSRNVGPFTMTLAEIAEKEPSESVRSAAVDLLGSKLTEFPALRAVLERSKVTDKRKKIRELAAQKLQGSLATPASGRARQSGG